MRVGEVASLRIGDVIDGDGKVKPEIRLEAEQTKGKHSRVVFVNERLGKEIKTYLKTIRVTDLAKPLFSTQKRAAFSANTLCQTLNLVYKRAGISGCHQPFWPPELHNDIGEQGCWRESARRTSWTPQHCRNAALHRCE
jgi:integrase